MSRTWEMKRKILKLLEGGRKMPSEISTELELAPSTVTQHLKELKEIGAIREVNDPFVKKWKYFELNPEFNAKILERDNMTKNKLPYAAALVVALLVIGSVVFLAVQSLHTPVSSGGTQTLVPVRLTDPPTVPNGAQALFIGYSSLQVHMQGQSNTTGWISSTGNGTINLMSLVNESQVIGSVKLSQNASVNMIRFNVTSASIVINGTAYNVTVPSGRVTARITGQGTVNGSTSLLLDLSPVVATIYTNTSTVFVLVPSVRAVVVGGANASAAIGSKTALSANDKAELESARPNITISAVSLSQSGNATQFSVTVKNSGNRSVQLSHILVYGNEIITVHPVPLSIVAENSSVNGTERANQTGNESERGSASVNATTAIRGNGNAITTTPSNTDVNGAVRGSGNASISINASARANVTAQDRARYADAGSNLSATERGGVVGEGASSLNIGANGIANLTGAGNALGSEHESEAINIEVNGTRFGTNSSVGAALLKQNDVQDLVNVGEDINSLRVINFQVAQNGQLVLPFSTQCAAMSAQASGTGAAVLPCTESGSEIPAMAKTGYNLTAGATATFTFSGTVSLAFGHITVSPVPGDIYNIAVRGEDGAGASANVTAA
jgi:hypothetical protein